MIGLLDIEDSVVIHGQKVLSLSVLWVKQLLSLQVPSNAQRAITIRVHTWRRRMWGALINQDMVQNLMRFKDDLEMEIAKRKESQKLEV